ncbi:hypothetical protein [Coxiella-like endosymbiont]|uniref:hypothetical protein n=1 Tax=Coxiella-like endosymbiont TaxID=1592897 RepID=UPI00272982CA|nr:hypothetical protein [Coxiella-like endosymbiont]
MGWIYTAVRGDYLINQGEKISFGFDEITFKKRRESIKAQGLNWQLCATELSSFLRGLIENHIGQVSIPLGLSGPCIVKGTYV